MAETRYDVIFRGEIAAGHTVEDVKEKLAALYKGDHAKIETMFGGKTVVIKRNLDHQKALEMQAMLKARSGAICELLPITPAAPDPAETAPQTPTKPTVRFSQPSAPIETPTPPRQEPARHEPRYNVVFYGEIVKGQNIKTVKQQLAQFFNVPAAIVEGMFRGERMALKEDVDYQAAEQYKQDFEQTGAVCRIEVAGQTAAQEAQKVVAMTPQPERARTKERTREETPRRAFRLGWQFIFAFAVVAVIASGAWAGYAWLSSPKRTLTHIAKAVQQRDLAAFQKYVATDQIINQLITQLPEIVRTEAGRKAFGDNMGELLDEEQSLPALLQRGAQSVIEQGKLDPALIDESDAIDKLSWILALDDPQKVKFKEFRQEGDHAILALETPVAVYDGAATLELTLRKTDWRTWQVSEINDLYHFVAQAADLQQTFPFRNPLGTLLYHVPEDERCHSFLAEELLKQGNIPLARFTIEWAATEACVDKHSFYTVLVTLAKLGKIQKAIKLIQQMEKAYYPYDKVHALADTAKILGQRGDEQQADKLFTEAFELAESLDEIRYREGALKYISDALSDIGNFDDALEVANMIIEDKDEKVEALGNIAAAIATTGDTKRADALFAQIFEQYDMNTVYLYRSLIQTNHLDKVLELARSLDKKNKSWVLCLTARELIDNGNIKQGTEILEEALQTAQTIEDDTTKYWELRSIALEYAEIDESKAIEISRWLENVNNKEVLISEDEVTRTVNVIKHRTISSKLSQKLSQFIKIGKFDEAFEFVNTMPENEGDEQQRINGLLSIAGESILNNLSQVKQAELAKRIMVDELHIPMPTTLYAAQPSPLQSPQQTKPAQAVAEKVEKEDEKTLSRQKAEKLINAFYRYPAPVSATLDTKDDYCYGFAWDGKMKIMRKTWDVMKDAGGIDYTITRQKNPGQYNMGCTDEFHITLTDEGLKHFIRGDNESFAIVAACEKVFLEVTGITDFEFGVKGKKIDYLWMLANPTPFSILENDCVEEINRPQEGEAFAVLYDDGWRIIER